MYPYRQSYFSRLAKSFPMLKLIDLYDRHSFIREYVLDNIFVCIFMYFLFYVGLWYANKVIRRIEEMNKRMSVAVEANREKLEDVIALKNKGAEYEEIIIKAKNAQNETTKQLDNEMKRLSMELLTTTNKMFELEKTLGKYNFWGDSLTAEAVATREGESPEGVAGGARNAIENVKVLEPSFPPPQPPPRKYGIFVTRPPGHRPGHNTPPPTPGTPPPKIGFK